MKFKLTISKVYNRVAVMKALRKQDPNLSLRGALDIVNNVPYIKISDSNCYGHLPVILDGIADCTYERILSDKEKINEALISFNKKALEYAIKWRKSLSIHDRICHEFLIKQAIKKAKIYD